MGELHIGDIVKVIDPMDTYDCYGCFVRKYEPELLGAFRCDGIPKTDNDYKIISIHPHEKWKFMELAVIEDCNAPHQVYVVALRALQKIHIDIKA